MFQSAARLPHVLTPEQYCSERAFQMEQGRVVETSWQLVGSVGELANPGDFLTCCIAGKPVQVRNFDGQLRALSNVCAHRHSLIQSAASGHSASMRCQYHGWEYQSDGRTGKIPQPRNFKPVDRDLMRLPVYQVQTLGQLVFVNLSSSGQSLQADWGESLAGLVQQRFDETWRLGLSWRPNYAVNWKIPVENSLESYHVPAVHAHTFREDPGAERTEHTLEAGHTSMTTQLPFAPHSQLDRSFQRLESRIVRWLGYQPTNQYSQLHVFPNLLFSFTDAISLVHCVLPISARASLGVVLQFGRMPTTSGFRELVARFWNRLKAGITQRIMREDLIIYEAIQQGLAASPHRGVLGICEERIHQFQLFLQKRCEGRESE